jgi:hypothetical protein
MSSLLVHFGTDQCHRLPVLRRAGYSTHECSSLIYLHSALIRFPQVAAVAVPEEAANEPEDLISLVRTYSSAALILFQRLSPLIDPSDFNLVIAPLTDASVWLDSIAEEIERSRLIRKQSENTREEAAAVRKISRMQRERSARLRDPSEFPGACWLHECPSAPTEPELMIGYDENYRPMTGVCTACGEAMPTYESSAGTSTDQINHWLSAQFQFHVWCKHRAQESTTLH